MLCMVQCRIGWVSVALIGKVSLSMPHEHCVKSYRLGLIKLFSPIHLILGSAPLVSLRQVFVFLGS